MTRPTSRSLPHLTAAGCLFGLLLSGGCLAAGQGPVMVQDYEKASSLPSAWVVDIPSEDASVRLSAADPFQGKQCLKLHYRFTTGGGNQYLGIPNRVSIQAPIHTLRYRLKGDASGSGYGLRLLDADGETHQYKGGVIDFKGWREVVVDLDAPHETWGGDKNEKLDYPVTSVILIVSHPADKTKLPVESDLYYDAVAVDSEKSAAETLGSQISVVSPGYCSDIHGRTPITLSAPGFKSVTVRCWKQGPGFGSDSTVAAVPLDSQGGGSFVFPADRYPHGPLTLTISGGAGAHRDNCCLQLYNRGGVRWNEGIPRAAPPAARGMTLAFADDFTGPLSISGTDPKATYYDHKPPGGSQDFSTLPFTSYGASNNPFTQVDSYLRIRASERAHSSGLLSSLKNDGTGIKVAPPCYFECRFLGPNAVGTWPAFWLMTDYLTDSKVLGDRMPSDELDVIEAYGGEGTHEPTAEGRPGDWYMVTPHEWNQGDAGKAQADANVAAMHDPVVMHRLGIPSTWYQTFHTYGCKVTATDTIYYCDDIEVGRHPTQPVTKKYPLFFMVNLATGGGWPVDLSRYGGLGDMYVDYVRVYKQRP